MTIEATHALLKYLDERWEAFFKKPPKRLFAYSKDKETPLRRFSDGHGLKNYSAVLILYRLSVRVAVVEDQHLLVGNVPTAIIPNLVWVNLEEIHNKMVGFIFQEQIERYGGLTPLDYDQLARLGWYLGYGRHTRDSYFKDSEAKAKLSITGDEIQIKFYSSRGGLLAVADTLETYAYYCHKYGIPYNDDDKGQIEPEDEPEDAPDDDQGTVSVNTPITRERLLDSEFAWEKYYIPALHDVNGGEMFYTGSVVLYHPQALDYPEDYYRNHMTASVDFAPLRVHIGRTTFRYVRTMEALTELLKMAGFTTKDVVYVYRGEAKPQPITRQSLADIGWDNVGLPDFFTSREFGGEYIAVTFLNADEFKCELLTDYRQSSRVLDVSDMRELRKVCIQNGITYDRHTYDPVKEDYLTMLGWPSTDTLIKKYWTASADGHFRVEVTAYKTMFVRIWYKKTMIRDLTGRVESMRSLFALTRELGLRWNYHIKEDAF